MCGRIIQTSGIRYVISDGLPMACMWSLLMHLRMTTGLGQAPVVRREAEKEWGRCVAARLGQQEC
jgi:hypothetical protein